MTRIEPAPGRVLDVQSTGPAEGLPLVMHHGTPGSVVQFRGIAAAVQQRGLRLVTYSRPGYGASTRVPGRRVADVAADLAAILDHLGAPRCVTLGWSGGGPHALASAALLPGRVAAATSIAGIAPFGLDDLDFTAGMAEENVQEFGSAAAGEEALAAELEPAAAALRGAGIAELMDGLGGLLPAVDRAVLAGESGEDLAAQFTEAVRDGAHGWIDDDLAFTGPWGFEPGEISVPTFLWQGDADKMVPFAHGRWLAEYIPGTVAHLLPGEGHISVFVNHLDEVLDELVAAL